MSSYFEQFCQTIARLRGPEGCPWDREQTYKSLTRYLLEESYEVLDAINTEDFNRLKSELGDLLLQIVLQAQLATEDGRFDIDDVAKSINDKMIARHPHVFSGKRLETSEEVSVQWEKLKDAEKELAKNENVNTKDAEKELAKNENVNTKDAVVRAEKASALAGVPEGLPALLKALKISEKAVNQGFEWEKEEDIWTQLKSELEEFKQETDKLSGRTQENVISSKQGRNSSVAREDLYLEMGDVLFTMVNIARWHKVDPEEALLLAIEKFKKRFLLMEKRSSGSLKEKTFTELEDLWCQAKEALKKENSECK